MKVLVALNHPAHYYVFKFTVLNLKNLGYDVKYVIREKDILEKLLISEKVDFIKINEKRQRKSTVFSVVSNGIIELVKQDFNLLKLVVKWKPDLMIGTDVAITHVGILLRIPSFVFNEDDFEINQLFCITSYPFASKIVSPDICSVGKYSHKKVSYNGIQKMAYLHPAYFRPDFELVKDIVGDSEKYFLIRLVSLTSGHDIEGKHTGINDEIIEKLILLLEKHGKVFINNEGKINPRYEKYRLIMNPNLMHHFLAFASMLVGDSQTMCAEAGLLGTPFIRFNDFVGKIGYLNEIENDYSLGFGIETKYPEIVIKKAIEIINMPNAKADWQKKIDRIFNEKVDVTAYYTNLIIQQLNGTKK
jgi:predicted glycosyltransferase